jgi:hypothetical protein
MTKAFVKTLTELVQTQLDKEHGEGKAIATEKGTIKFCFPTTHHGCNEMVAGAWKLNKTNKLSFVYSVDYTEAYEYLKAGTKPVKDEIIAMDTNAFNFLAPKDIA